MQFDRRGLFIENCAGEVASDVVTPITGPLACNISQLASNCLKRLGEPKSAHSQSLREGLSRAILRFHQDAGLEAGITERVGSLTRDDTLILRVAHQPNIFPYIGVVGQFVVMHALASEIMKVTHRDVSEVFLFVDYDVASEERFRTSQLPDVSRKSGRLLLNYPIHSGNENLLMKYVTKPDDAQVKKWIDIIADCYWSSMTTLKEKGFDTSEAMRVFEDSKDELIEVIKNAESRAKSFADFNEFFISYIISKKWDYPTMFARFSEFQSEMQLEYEALIPKFETINQLVSQAKSFLVREAGEDPSFVKGYYAKRPPPNQFPLWLVCQSCHNRTPLMVTNQTPLEVAGECPNRTCRENHSFSLGTLKHPDLAQIIDRVVPRIEFQNLCLLPSLGFLGALGYIGAADHSLVTYYVAKNLELRMPVLFLSRPSVVYAGLGQFRAFEEPYADKDRFFDLASSARLCAVDLFVNFGLRRSESVLFEALSRSQNLMRPELIAATPLKPEKGKEVKMLEYLSKTVAS